MTAEPTALDSLELEFCELPRGCWELNPGPLQEQQMLSTTKSSVQPHTD